MRITLKQLDQYCAVYQLDAVINGNCAKIYDRGLRVNTIYLASSVNPENHDMLPSEALYEGHPVAHVVAYYDLLRAKRIEHQMRRSNRQCK